MKKISQYLLMISLLFIPSLAYASSTFEVGTIGFALAMEAFVSMHMSVFFLKPMASILAKENSKKVFWELFLARVVFLLFFDFFVTPNIFVVDFISVFIGAFLVVPISHMIAKKKGIMPNATPIASNAYQISGIELKCTFCNSLIQITDSVCPKCGKPIDGNNIRVLENANSLVQVPNNSVLSSNFDEIYRLPEEKMLEEFINRELVKAGVDKTTNMVPRDLLKRKRILNIIFSFLLFFYITLIFFHFPIYTYIIGAIILIVFFKITISYSFIKYLKKQLKARPGEIISNIIMNEKNNLSADNTKVLFAIGLIVSIILPLVIFSSPRIFYEKTEGGYAVRYYAFGLTNFKTVTIPETYKNEKVVSLRGNTFSNMPFLESVELPDTIIEIRGQAFKNCRKLTEVNIPKNLEYLGGSAFYNAKSIKKVELPDTLTYLGGESFYGASSLEYIKLSNNLTEIRGDSFEYCTSLNSITIPDSVTRIGGHAFYGDSSLAEVIISENSQLTEIGSSAFRQCPSLHNITIPYGTYVNERAFKESPTKINYSTDDSKYRNYYYSAYITLNETIKFELNNHSQYSDELTLDSIYDNSYKFMYNNKSYDGDIINYFVLNSYNKSEIIGEYMFYLSDSDSNGAYIYIYK